jgi:DinB superfamily
MNASEAAAHQYRSTLAMLCKAIELCPEHLWLAGSPNRFWHIAYHALFYTHFYLALSDAEFVPWQHHRAEYNYLGEVPLMPGYKPKIDQPYSQPELLEYQDFCVNEVERQMAVMDPEAPSGFHWLPFTKLELQYYNLRHLAHHTGQLAERLRTCASIGLPWIR